jgi:hypothetical protein
MTEKILVAFGIPLGVLFLATFVGALLRDRQELTALVGRETASRRLDQTAEPDSLFPSGPLAGLYAFLEKLPLYQ